MRIQVLAILLLSCCGAQAAPGRCLLRVDGATYLDGPCNVMLRGDGGFSIGMGDTAEEMSPFFAAVNKDDDGRMAGFWNAQKGATHAQTSLGRLRRNGGCWENATASVCAWR